MNRTAAVPRLVLGAIVALLAQWPVAAEDPPTAWIESTGHRVVRLSREGGSASLYFHQNQYTAGGDKMIIATREGLSTIDLETHAIEPLVAGRVSHVVVGRKTRQVFYVRGDTVFVLSLIHI